MQADVLDIVLPVLASPSTIAVRAAAQTIANLSLVEENREAVLETALLEMLKLANSRDVRVQHWYFGCLPVANVHKHLTCIFCLRLDLSKLRCHIEQFGSGRRSPKSHHRLWRVKNKLCFVFAFFVFVFCFCFVCFVCFALFVCYFCLFAVFALSVTGEEVKHTTSALFCRSLSLSFSLCVCTFCRRDLFVS